MGRGVFVDIYEIYFWALLFLTFRDKCAIIENEKMDCPVWNSPLWIVEKDILCTNPYGICFVQNVPPERFGG